jgi:VWFA-related protein
MRGRLALMVAACALVQASGAQNAASPAQGAATAPPVRATAPMVMLDVVVEDQDGHPVRGLKVQNFRLTEGGVAQTIGALEEHPSQVPPAATATYPSLPPGTFTDYTPIASDSTLSILLIDALNTPMKDQAFVRYELQQYVNHANPDTHIAVFGLANRPILLQGFTSDPAVLRDVVERKLIPRSASVLRGSDETAASHDPGSNPSSSAAATTNNGSPSAIELAANLREFEAKLGGMETELCEHYTLDAFNTLAHYLAAFPGRKNLIWFSGSFPFTILPNPSLAGPSNLDGEEFRETVNLLSKAQVAVYPIDARALMTEAALDAANPGSAGHTDRFNAALAKAAQTDAAEHMMMNELATSTGGRAFANTHSLADAVTSDVAAGSDYYALSYTPANTKQDGAYRPIRVDTTGVHPAQPLQLFYRRGYYTSDASHLPKPTLQDSSAAPPEETRANAYKHAAMSRGAPTPEDIVFKVRVLPAATTTETSPAPDNQLSLSVPTTGPFRRYDLDYISLPGELTFTQQPDGHHIAKVEFLAYVFDTEGRLLDETGKDISLEATPANFAALLHSVLRCHLELSVPDRTESFLRIGIRDITSNKFGVVEIPASSVSSLPAATHAAAPASGRPTPPRD